MTQTDHHEITDVQRRTSLKAFGKPLITNVFRGLIAEAIVAKALGREWEWCSDDYSAWDFSRGDGVNLEVKQSAVRQSWRKEGDPPSKSTFDIRERKGRQDGAAWIEGRRRWADVYVFAHHFVDEDWADHRDPSQWMFYVAPTNLLPMQGTIALSRVRALSRQCDVSALGTVVQQAMPSAIRQASLLVAL